jgi:hypothetical protein
MAKIGLPIDALALVLAGMFWLMPVLLSSTNPILFEPVLSWVEWGLGTLGIVGGIIMASNEE